MFRSLPVIIAAIQLSQPRVNDAEARRFAVALQEQARVHEFDPLTGVSVIFHESSFNPGAVSRDGEDYGLAQIRARFVGDCAHTKSPNKRPTAACRKEKQRLLVPEENIRVMAELITRHRRLCKRKVGSARFARWLASYQGRNDIRKKRYCRPGKGTYRVIRFRRKLIRALYERRLLKAPR